jgi:3-phosphoshikimate 1-carboxyvinyltransferase
LTIHPPAQIRPAEIRTYDDHRMAMSFSIAGLVADGIVIRDAGCVSKSFPEFFEVLGNVRPA